MTYLPGKSWRILTACLAVSAVLLQPARAEDKWPSQPIRFVVAFAPGGITDIMARIIGERLSDKLGTIVIDNKGGAAGAVGAKMVATSKPDGYTFLVTTTALTINAAASPAAVDPRSQFVPIAMVARAPSVIATRNPTTFTSLSAYAREQKDITYSSAGVGTVEHLTAAYVLGTLPGVRATHVPYRSGGESVNAAIGGHVNLVSTPLGSAMAFIQDKQLQVLGVANHTRLAVLPDAPTLGEVGLPDVENGSWVAIFGPLGLPDAIAHRVNAEVNGILGQEEFRERVTKMGFDLRPLSQQQFADQMRAEVDKWGAILKETGITLN